MFILFGIVVIIVCILLIGIVLIQNPKGGGVNAAMGGVSNQIFGANRSTDMVERWTWYFAAALIFLALASILVVPSGKLSSTEAPESEVEKALKEGAKPASPATSTPVGPAIQSGPIAPANSSPTASEAPAASKK